MANHSVIRWPSPAKLNLFLHINGRQDNGYHKLQTLFQLLDVGDSMVFTPNDSGKVILTTPLAGVLAKDNLIIRAAECLRKFNSKGLGCDIAIDKKLPMGGGIGGGSSNAATTLVALNHYWQLGLSTETLCNIGLSLGADVPVFVNGQTAFASGVGEQLTAVNLAEQHYLVAVPDNHVSTASVFQHPDLPRNTAEIDFRHYDFEHTHNDCEKIVINSHPNIAKTLRRLLEYAPSRMTGTGACVFAVFSCKADAQTAFDALRGEMRVFLAEGRNTSPLNEHLRTLKNRA